jgi:hypothetical protein
VSTPRPITANTPRIIVIVAIAALLLAAAALALGLSAYRRAGATAAPGDISEPNLVDEGDRIESPAERARMEQHVAQLQAEKRVLKTFDGPSGEIIDCVDVYAQPALKRQGMEGHVIQLEPTSRPPDMRAEQGGPPPEQQAQAPAGQQQAQAPTQLFTLTGQTCPDKSAPMARLTMDTLKHFRTLDEFFRKESELEPPTGGSSGSSTHEYAHAARTVENWGAESIFNLWSPYVERADEFSLSQIWVVRGSGGDRETVEGGWQVYRDLYGDWRAHLFIYFTPDNYGSGGCYNLSCRGFVQVNNTVYIAGGFTSYSSHGGAQPEFKLLWYKDRTEGHWWLRYGDTWVGYYPRTLFDDRGLRDRASRVDFGGEIINTRTDNRHTRTDMGSGRWPYQGYAQAAYQRGLRYVDTSNFYQRATGLNRSVTNNMCYDLSLHSSSGSWEEYFYFGGSGFNTSCP